jgi:UDP-N-acetylglucosamine 2-epimerase (non-hydrolysing)
MKKKIMLVAGARPNFVKIAPLLHEISNYKKHFSTVLVHTGQHYDFKMSEIFFKDLNIPEPDIHLNVGSGSHASQTANIMTAFEKVVLKEKPAVIVVVGDVNSTVACSLVASKLNVKVAHVEAGLRSFDRTMPEEINRIVTDSLSDYLFVSEQSGLKNLKKEGISTEKVFFVGNVMIDTLFSNRDKINKSAILENLFPKKTPSPSQPVPYAVLTLHRPGNVDAKQAVAEIYTILKKVSGLIKIIYPIHPRALKMIEAHSYLQKFKRLNNLTMIEPLGYIDFMKLVSAAAFVLTDSGGIQEETTVLKVPCLTMRGNTERPVTITAGTNILVGRSHSQIVKYSHQILAGKFKHGKTPKLWDGKTAGRIVKILDKLCTLSM